jgi:hypothetical protein
MFFTLASIFQNAPNPYFELYPKMLRIDFGTSAANVKNFLKLRFMSYLKHSSWRQILKLLSNFGCIFTFCYLDEANSMKTDLDICNLWTGQFVSYKSVI